jgi:hypothetical protein
VACNSFSLEYCAISHMHIIYMYSGQQGRSFCGMLCDLHKCKGLCKFGVLNRFLCFCLTLFFPHVSKHRTEHICNGRFPASLLLLRAGSHRSILHGEREFLCLLLLCLLLLENQF